MRFLAWWMSFGLCVTACGGDGSSASGGESDSSNPDSCCDNESGAVSVSGTQSTSAGSLDDEGGAADSAPIPQCFEDQECEIGFVCVDGSCIALTGCHMELDPPMCGNGIVQSFEECDGGADCDECRVITGPDFDYTAPGTPIDALSLGAEPTAILAAGGTPAPVWAAALTATGVETWNETQGDPGVSIRDAVIDPLGTSVVVGGHTPDVAPNWWAVRLDALGQVTWTLSQPITGDAWAVDLDEAGNAVIGGTGFIMTFAPNGNQVESHISAASEVRGLVSLGMSDTVAVGYIDDDPGAGWIGRVTDGAVAWQETITLEGDGPEVLYDVAQTPSGDLVAVGAADFGPWIVVYDANGTQLASETCVGGVLGRFSSVASHDGGYAVGGEWRATGEDPENAWVTLIDTGLSPVWSRSVSLTDGTSEAAVTSVAGGDLMYVSGFSLAGSELSGWVRGYAP